LSFVSVPGNQAGLLAIVAAVGTTLAPWGLAFITSYAADKRVPVSELRYATLHAQGREIVDASDAASALEPLAGHLASSLFAVGLLGAALLAASVVPLSTAYSVSEACGHDGRLDDRFADARVFYLS